jgi:type I restriction enzyme, S subunit
MTDKVKPGYKQTEVGVIPEDWVAAPLGGHSTFKTGPFGSLLHRSDYVDGGVPIINPMQILDGKLVPTQSMTISEVAARRLAAFRFSVGDVVIGRRGDMGRCAYVEAESDGWLCGTGSMIVSCRGLLSSRFLQRVLASPPIIAAIENASVGTTMVNLNTSTLQKLLIPLPPTLAEQEAIAGALSDADGLIESLEQLVAKKRRIKQGAMQELLTGQKRLPGFATIPGCKQSTLGALPNDWTPTPLGKLIHSVDYGSSAKSSEKGRTPVLRMGNLQGGKIDWSDLVYTNDASEISRYSLRPGDVLFNRTNTIDLVGKSAIYLAEHPAVFAGYLIRINVIPELLDSKFLNYVLNTEFSRIHSSKILSVPVGQANINGQKLKTYPIPVPPTRSEQSAIAAILSDMDAEIAGLEAKLAKARRVKQGMMQELLMGRIRLV